LKIGAVNDFRNDLCDEIKLIASEGFDFVDLTLEPLFSREVDPGNVKQALEESGIEVIGHTSPFLPVIFPLKKIRQASFEEFSGYIDFFSRLGVSLMNLHPSDSIPLMDPESVFRYNREFISKVNRICREKGITLMVETVLKPFNTPEIFERLLDGMEDIMVHLDVGHCNISTDRDLVDEFFRVFGKRIVHVHLSDNHGDLDRHLPLGCGNIDWARIISILRRYGYDSTLTLEVFTGEREYLLYSKKFLERLLGEK